MNHKTKTSELIRTVRLVAECGVKGAALTLRLTSCATTYRVQRLEKQLDFRIFAPYDYDRLTWQGREYLKNENIDCL